MSTNNYGIIVRLAERVAIFAFLSILSASTAYPQESPQLTLRVRMGHHLQIDAAAFNSEGNLLLTSDENGRIALWDSTTGQEIYTSLATYWVKDLAFSPDSRLFASAEGWKIYTSGRILPGRIGIWNTLSGKRLALLEGHSDDVVSVAFSPDGKWIASGSHDRTVRVWDVASGKELWVFAGLPGPVNDVAFSKDGKQIIAGFGSLTPSSSESRNGVSIIDIETRRVSNDLEGHPAAVYSVAASPDGSTCASASTDGTVIFRNAENNLERNRVVGSPAGASDIAFGPEGKILAVGTMSGKSGSIEFWKTGDGEPLGKIAAHEGAVTALAYSPAGNQIATGGADQKIKFWDANSRALQKILPQGDAGVMGHMELSPDSSRVSSAGADEPVRTWDLAEGRPHALFKDSTDFLGTGSVSFSPDGKKLVATGSDKHIRMWDVESGKQTLAIEAHDEYIQMAIFSPDGQTILSASIDDTAKIWDARSGALLKTFRGHSDDINSAFFSPDGRLLATSSTDKTVIVWDIATGEKKHVLRGHTDSVWVARFDRSGRIIASTSADDTIRIWDANTGKELKVLRGHKDDPVVPDFSPDGTHLVSSSYDEEARIWDIESGKTVKLLKGHVGAAWTAYYSADGKYIVTNGYGDKTIRFWDPDTGEEIIKLLAIGEEDWVVSTPDGRFDASPGGLELIHYTYGLEIIELKQLKEGYYEPGLLQKVLGFSKEPLRPIVPLKDIKLHPEIIGKDFDPSTNRLKIRLRARRGGVGRTEVFVNNKLVVPDARNVDLVNNPSVKPGTEVELSVDLSGASMLRGEENDIRIVTSNYLPEIGKGNIQSRGVGVKYADKREKDDELPTFFAIVGGVSDYEGDEIDLRFASKDAEEFAGAVTLGARRLFCPGGEAECLGKIDVTTLTTSGKEGTIEPTKENFRKAFAEVARKAKPTDILVIYLAGHGVALGNRADTYFYLTKEARSASKEVLEKRFQTDGISSSELVEWLTQTEWVEGKKGIPALKQVMILDTCAAGTAAPELNLIAKRELTTDQKRAIEFLKDKTGTFILMGSAADAPAYEASQFGQGLLTRSLLEGMKGAALDRDLINIQKLFAYALKQVPRLAGNLQGIQEPVISVPEGEPFVIGQMTEQEKRMITLAAVKPFFSRPNLGVPPVGNDPLRINSALRKRLEDESSFEMVRRRGDRQDTSLVYIDADEFPGAIRVTGNYDVNGEDVEIQAYLLRDETVIMKLPQIRTGKEAAVEALVEMILSKIGELDSR